MSLPAATTAFHGVTGKYDLLSDLYQYFEGFLLFSVFFLTDFFPQLTKTTSPIITTEVRLKPLCANETFLKRRLHTAAVSAGLSCFEG